MKTSILRRLRPYLLAILVLVPQVALAASTIPQINGQGKNGDNSNALVAQFGFLQGQPYSLNGVGGVVWAQIMDHIVLPVLGGVAILFIIYAGIQYITARGNAEATKKARQTIMNVLLGIILLIAAYGIIALIVGLARHFATTFH